MSSGGDALIALAAGATTLVVSVVASGLAASKSASYFERIKLEGDPIGFTPEDITYAVELSIARFQLWLLTFSAPVYVGINASSTGNFIVTSSISLAVTLGTLVFLFRLEDDRKFDSRGIPRNYAAWTELAGIAGQYQVTKVDLWSALVVLGNVVLVLA